MIGLGVVGFFAVSDQEESSISCRAVICCTLAESVFVVAVSVLLQHEVKTTWGRNKVLALRRAAMTSPR